MYAFWSYWQLYQKVTFDGVNKLITVNEGVTSLDIRGDVYSAWVEWQQLETNTGFLPTIRYTGLDLIPGGLTGDSYFLINGWRLLVDLSNVAVKGVLFSDDYSSAYYNTAGKIQFPATVSSLVSTVIVRENVVTGDLSSISPSVIAAAVRTNLTPELTKINAQVDGLTSTQQTMLLEIYKLYGLDPSVPLVVTSTNRSAGTINQTINTNTSQTTITRV